MQHESFVNQLVCVVAQLLEQLLLQLHRRLNRFMRFAKVFLD
jgi:hypothetical protein